jgi:hypothetical protein
MGNGMNLKCLFGFHEWGGCKCTKCGAGLDQDHDWRVWQLEEGNSTPYLRCIKRNNDKS